MFHQKPHCFPFFHQVHPVLNQKSILNKCGRQFCVQNDSIYDFYHCGISSLKQLSIIFSHPSMCKCQLSQARLGSNTQVRNDPEAVLHFFVGFRCHIFMPYSCHIFIFLLKPLSQMLMTFTYLNIKNLRLLYHSETTI